MATSRILIVDDEPRVAFFLSKALEHVSKEYQIDIAHSGEEAKEKLARTSVDLIVTDLKMPGMSGIDLMRWVRTAYPATRTILITAYGNDEVEAETRRLDAYRYITKPFNLNDFAQVVRDALQDGAVSQPGLVILSDESFEAITKELESLCHDVGAQCIFLSDMLGQRLVEVGITDGFDASALLSLIAGGFATAGELARQFGTGEAANLNYHQGTRYEIYSATIGDNLFMAMLYERRVQASRIGIVWLYTHRAIDRLLAILSASSTGTSMQILDEEFGSSLMAELDSIFPGSEEEPALVHQEEMTPPTPASVDRPAPVEPDTPLETSIEDMALPPDVILRVAEPKPKEPEVEEPPELLEMGEATNPKDLLSLEDAIARGLIPGNLAGGQGPIIADDHQEK
jgi:CheY-like chemotaxis protein